MARHVKIALKATALGVLANVALAGSNAQAAELLVNGSFESPVIAAGSYTYPGTTAGSWTYGGSALVGATGYNAWYGNTAPAGQDGAQFAALQSSSTLSQSFSYSGTSATLTWTAAGRPFFGGYDGDQTYIVLIDSVAVGSTYSTSSGQAFTAQSISLTGLTAGTHLLTFAGQTTADETSFIDNVSITAVPEPATWAMMLIGFGMVGYGMRRRSAVRTTLRYA